MKPFDLFKVKKFFAVGVSCAAAIFLFLQPVTACSWDYFIWQNREKNSDPYYRFVEKGKVGYIDQTGKIVIKPTLTEYGNYQRGVISGALAKEYDEFIDFKTGEEVSPEAYYRKANLSDGLIKEKFEDKFGFIDIGGKTIIEPAFVFAKDFNEGFAPVVVEGPCFYYNVEAACPGDAVFPYSPNTAPTEACKFNFIDKTGKLISKQTFLDIKDFSEGRAPVRTPEGWGYIDKTGKIVIAPQFENAQTFSDGLALVKVGELYGFIDASGAFVIKPQFKSAENFANGLAPVGEYGAETVNNKFYYIDKKGNRPTKDTFLLASHFFKGIAHVLLSETFKNEIKDGEESEIRTQTFAYINQKSEKIFVYTVEDRM